MYEYFDGKFDLLTPTHVVIDVGGIGFLLNISLNTYAKIKDLEGGRLYVSFQVREDAHTLYGFADREERRLFEMLISVSGIGPSIGRVILSSLTTEEVYGAISTGNVAVLRTIKGIGPKTAQRLILELQDKISKQGISAELVSATITGSTSIQVQEEAAGALVLLGFARAQIDKCLSTITKENPGLTVEGMIKEALRRM
jgi:Holliday junction DNA helicase RuvA